MFYSLKQDPINLNNFITEYQEQYYIGSRTKIPKNKTSPFVEHKIEEILHEGLSPYDLILVIAWKIGAINHNESVNSVIYLNDFDKTLRYQTRFNLLDVHLMIEYISDNFAFLNRLAQSEPYNLYEKLFEHRATNFGATYVLTLVYFFTRGVCPIYDKYADIALQAISLDLAPHNYLRFKTIDSSNNRSSWKRYMQYCETILKVFGNEIYKERTIDRSLWVYGHYFNTQI